MQPELRVGSDPGPAQEMEKGCVRLLTLYRIPVPAVAGYCPAGAYAKRPERRPTGGARVLGHTHPAVPEYPCTPTTLPLPAEVSNTPHHVDDSETTTKFARVQVRLLTPVAHLLSRRLSSTLRIDGHIASARVDPARDSHPAADAGNAVWLDGRVNQDVASSGTSRVSVRVG